MSAGDADAAAASAATGPPPTDPAAVLGEEALAALPDAVRAEVARRWEAFVGGIEEHRVRAEREGVLREHKSCEMEADLDLTRQRLETKIREVESRDAEIREINEKFTATKSKVLLLEETSSRLNVENGSLKRERDQLGEERNDLFALAERRQAEIDRVHEDWRSLSKQLEEANAARCGALVKAEEVESKELSLRYREKRMEEERQYLQGQVTALDTELRQRNEENIALRREQTAKLADLQSKLASKSEEVRVLEGKEEALREDNDTLRKRLEELMDKLRTARDAESRTEEHYRQELLAQQNLAQHYKSHCDDSEQKSKDLEKAITELQGLLKQSSDRYGSLEDSLEREKVEHKEEIQRRNEALRALRKELEDANHLIQTLKAKGLSPEGIENLAPSAAAASKLLKSGMTLTQVFSQLVAVQEELLVAKAENAKLNTYLEQILKEIEERAPALKRQREDYDRAVSAVATLTTQLEEARQEYEFRKREAGDARQRMGTVTRENERMAQQVRDLGRQVTMLVREVEASRADTSRRLGQSPGGDPNRSLDSESVINERLLTFGSVSELQQKNIELLAVVRELSSTQEAAESRLVEEKTAELKKELEAAMRQLEELRAGRQRQEAMVESIVIERDMYKTIAARAQEQQQQPASVLASPAATSTPALSAPAAERSRVTPSPRARHVSFQELEKRATESEAQLKELQKDFDEYREEKHKNDEIVGKELSEAKQALNEARAKAIKLTAQEEYNTERFKIANSNAETYKKQAKLLEERSVKLSSVVAKHEETMEVLRNEVLACQSKLSQAEVQLDFLRHEKSVLKAAEARLVQENEILHRQKSSSSLVLENLNLVKLNLERAEEEKTMRLRNKNEDLEKEVAMLRKKIDLEQQQYKEAVKAWEASAQELRDRLEEAQQAEKKFQEEKQAASARLEAKTQECGELQEKLEMAESTLSTRGVTVARQDSHSHPETSAKVRDLQLQLNQSKNEVAALKEQLESSKQAASNFKGIADSAEKRLGESNNAAKALKDDLEARLSKASQEKEALEKKLAETEEAGKRDGAAADTAATRAALESAREEASGLAERLRVSEGVAAQAREESSRQIAAAREAQEKYQRELVLHAQDVESLTVLKASVGTHQAEVQELLEARRAAEEALAQSKANVASVEATLKEEYGRLREQFGVVEEENKTLHQQLSTVSQQMTSLQKHFEGNPDASRSFSEDESKSAEQLMQIIKYLRREKEILSSKIEVVQAESSRIRSQMEHKEKQLEEAVAALNSERERGSSANVSSSKYADLLQKVQTVSALSDSNRMLREEKVRLEEELSGAKASLAEASAELVPMRERQRTAGEREETLRVEMQALKQDGLRWKARADQLVEKQQKINPEELKKLQNDNSTLTRQNAQLHNNFKSVSATASGLSTRVKNLEAEAAKGSAALTQKTAELAKAQQDLQKLKTNFQNRLTQLNAKIAEVDRVGKQAQAERDAARGELAAARAKGGEDAQKAQGELAGAREEGAKQKKAIEELKATLMKVRKIGRDYKEKFEKTTAELEKVKKESAAAAASASSDEVKKLREENEELKKSDEEHVKMLEDTSTNLEELEEKVSTLEGENEELTRKNEEITTKMEKFKEVLTKLKDAKQSGSEATEALAQEADARLKVEEEYNQFKKAHESTTNKLRQEKASAVADFQKEKEALQARIDALSQELEEARQAGPSSGPGGAPAQQAEKPAPETVSVKPMASKAAEKPQRPQKQVQHIQPHMRHVPPATATIRPQRGAAAVALGRPQGQSPSSSPASAEVAPVQASVQPIVSVSPSSAAQAQPPAAVAVAPSPLNPAAAEFTPAAVAATPASFPAEEAAPRTRVMVTPLTEQPVQPQQQPQQQQPQAQPQPGPSSGAAPAAKRPREEETETTDTESKKARTTAVAAPGGEDDVVVLDSEEENEPQVEDGEEVAEPEEGDYGGEEEEETQEDETQEDEEEGMDEEAEPAQDDDDEPVEVEQAEPEDVEDVDTDSQQLQIAEGDGDAVVVEPEAEEADDGVGAGEVSGQGEMQPAEGAFGSVPAAVPQQQQQQQAADPAAAVQFEEQDDGVVPGTPKLAAPSQGLAEAPASMEQSPASSSIQQLFSTPEASAPAAAQPFSFAAAAVGTAPALVPEMAMTSADLSSQTAVDFAQFGAGQPETDVMGGADTGSQEEPLTMNAAPSDVAGQDAAMLEATSVEPAQPVIRPEEDDDVVEIEPQETRAAAAPPTAAAATPNLFAPSASSTISFASLAAASSAAASTAAATTAAPVGQSIQVLTSTTPSAPAAAGAAPPARGSRPVRIARQPIVWDMGSGTGAAPTGQAVFGSQAVLGRGGGPAGVFGGRGGGARGGGPAPRGGVMPRGGGVGRARRSRGAFGRGGK